MSKPPEWGRTTIFPKSSNCFNGSMSFRSRSKPPCMGAKAKPHAVYVDSYFDSANFLAFY